MPKKIVRVVMPKPLLEMLDHISRNSGLSYSEIIRAALIRYADNMGILHEYMRKPRRLT